MTLVKLLFFSHKTMFCSMCCIFPLKNGLKPLEGQKWSFQKFIRNTIAIINLIVILSVE